MTPARGRMPWVAVTAGVLTVVSPFVVGPGTPFAQWDIGITGAVMTLAALAQPSRGLKRRHRGALAGVNILGGVWLFISSTWMTGDSAIIWSNIALGTIAIVTALVSLSNERRSR